MLQPRGGHQGDVAERRAAEVGEDRLVGLACAAARPRRRSSARSVVGDRAELLEVVLGVEPVARRSAAGGRSRRSRSRPWACGRSAGPTCRPRGTSGCRRSAPASVLKPAGTRTGVPSNRVQGFQPSFSKPNSVVGVGTSPTTSMPRASSRSGAISPSIW